MLYPLFAGVTSFLVSFAFLPFVIRFSKNKKVVAVPGPRRIHKKITPSLGGVAIFFGFTIGCLCWSIDPRSSIVILLLPVLIIPFIIGLLDDLIHLRPAAKLIAQATTASLIFFFLDIRLISFYGLFGDGQVPEPVSYLLTLFTVILITNSLNLIDGIDGLAATFSFVACVFFGSWFYFAGHYPFALLCLSLAGGILAFLFQNWEPSNIFMGDTGSLVIGTMLSVLAIVFINENYALEQEHPLRFDSSVATAICVLIIPLADTTRIIIIRFFMGLSPFTPDKRHIHHALIRLGLNHRRAVYVLTLFHVFMLGLAIFFRSWDEWFLLAMVVTITILLCVFLNRLLLKNGQKET